MAKSITISDIDRRAGVVYIRVGHREIEIPAASLADLRAWITQQFRESEDLVLAIALAAYIARDPNFTNPSQLVGRTITLDLTGRINYPDSVLRVS